MTWSFQLLNGDFNPAGPSGLAVVTGTQKMVQDLRCALLTPLGTDPLHPDWGSSLDGGVDVNGVPLISNIGTQIDATRQLNIEAEVRRVLTAYQQSQIDRLLADQAAYGGMNTFSTGEILYSVDSIVITQVRDVLVVQCNITTADGNSLSLTTPIGAS